MDLEHTTAAAKHLTLYEKLGVLQENRKEIMPDADSSLANIDNGSVFKSPPAP